MGFHSLSKFIGKPVTIFTENIGRGFNDVQYNDYFTGICVSVDTQTIETAHPITGCRNIFFISKIIGISEEQELDPQNPEHQKIISEMKGENLKEDLPLSDSVNIDVDMLNKLVNKD